MKRPNDAHPLSALHFQLQTTPEAVRQALQDMRRSLETFDAAETTFGAWEIILAEVLNNIVKHAYQKRADGAIDVWFEVETSAFRVKVKDQGRPMPGLKLPAGAPADLSVATEDLPEGGFGWFLIRSMTEDLQYERVDQCNILRFAISS